MKRPVFTIPVLLTVLACASAVEAQTRLDLASAYSGALLQAETLREFAKGVKAATDGMLEIHVHEGGWLGIQDVDLFQAVRDGAVPMAGVLMGHAAKAAPIFALSTSPFLVKDWEDARILLEIAKPYYQKEAAKFNQKILYTSPWSPSAIHAKRAILKIEDLEGLKIRAYDRNGVKVLKKCGADAVLLPWNEVIPALASGKIEAVLTSCPSAVSLKFWEFLTDTTRVNFAIPLSMININLKVFDKLTREQQTALEKVGGAMEERQWKMAVKEDSEQTAFLESKGMKIHSKIPPELVEAFQERGKEVIEAWIANTGPVASQLISEYRKKVQAE